MYSGLTKVGFSKVLTLGKKKDEILANIQDVHISPMHVIDKCGEVSVNCLLQYIQRYFGQGAFVYLLFKYCLDIP